MERRPAQPSRKGASHRAALTPICLSLIPAGRGLYLRDNKGFHSFTNLGLRFSPHFLDVCTVFLFEKRGLLFVRDEQGSGARGAIRSSCTREHTVRASEPGPADLGEPSQPRKIKAMQAGVGGRGLLSSACREAKGV